MDKTKKPAAHAVGYRQPPKHSQFKKGKSGNPSGLPKKVKQFKSVRRVVREFLEQEIVVSKEGRRRKTMTLLEAILTRTGKSALDGHTPAIKLLIQLAEHHIPERQTLEDLMGGRPVFEFAPEEAARFTKEKLMEGMTPRICHDEKNEPARSSPSDPGADVDDEGGEGDANAKVIL
jgi:hypothetical protein